MLTVKLMFTVLLLDSSALSNICPAYIFVIMGIMCLHNCGSILAYIVLCQHMHYCASLVGRVQHLIKASATDWS